MLNLDNKKILITGASGGIGKSICQKFLDAGANLVASGTNEEKLEKLRNELGNKNINTIKANLSSSDEIANLAKQAIQQLDGLDVVICNAGITKDNLTMRMSEEDFKDVIDINLTSSFVLIKNILRTMMKNKSGKIIGISSVVGSLGNLGQANYVASKSGMEGMFRSIALEAASRGITANTIAPGFIETAMTEKLPEDIQNKMKERIPLGYFGKADDVANACIFLASDLSNYITGTTLHVNGGMLMR